MAFEQFEPWCLNKNVLQAYDYNFSDTIMLDRDENTDSSFRNPGMSSRTAFHVDFEDYSIGELCDIMRLMFSRKQMTMTDAAMEKLKYI